MHIHPTGDNVHALIDRAITGPVVMLNLLRLREVADYSEHPELAPPSPISGRAAYDLYVEHTLPFLEATGGSVVFLGEGGAPFVGPMDERWDLALLVGQTSIDDFFSFAEDPGYLAGLGHRSAAIEDSRLFPLVEVPQSQP